jgi:hypothetical protein
MDFMSGRITIAIHRLGSAFACSRHWAALVEQ